MCLLSRLGCYAQSCAAVSLQKSHPIEAGATLTAACQCISLFDNIKNSFALATSQPGGRECRKSDLVVSLMWLASDDLLCSDPATLHSSSDHVPCSSRQQHASSIFRDILATHLHGWNRRRQAPLGRAAAAVATFNKKHS